MNKVLKKYTTIPSELYVKRHADQQLARIIDEMERPGYVLVARQMGKTNLLFNAKRELENQDKLFVYVDLSNYFIEERECYHHIIDSILEPNDDLFSHVIYDIDKLRQLNISAHKEYTKSLRMILKAFSGDIIIILDEIDALRSADYSDHIFAQIRSNYFARTNFPDFNRLTYVLSGVIEPLDLIKDKNKSPFNIGEKIYLDDFSYKEHLQFIRKSKLNIDDTISQHLYNWTNGNPRLTFDICSDIEDFLMENISISIEEIDALIKHKYLLSFDMAPIDNIRDLVSSNSDIRCAVKDILLGNTEQINDSVKGKLYLYGIISLDPNSDSIKIKNKILEESLNINWIESLEKENSSLYEKAIYKISVEKDYSSAISMLKEYLKTNSDKLTANQKAFSYYYMGVSYRQLFDFVESNKYLNMALMPASKSAPLHYKQKLFISLNHLQLKQYEEAKETLWYIINNDKSSTSHINASLTLAMYLITSESNFEKGGKLLLDLLGKINDIEDLDLADDEYLASDATVISLFYLSLISSDKEKALNFIHQAMEKSLKQYMPQLIFQEIERSGNYSDCNVSNLVSSITKNKLKYPTQIRSLADYTEECNNAYLLSLYNHKKFDLFNELLDYTLEHNNINKVSLCDKVIELALNSQDYVLSLKLLRAVLSKRNLSTNEKHRVLKQISYLSFHLNISSSINDFKRYKSSLINNTSNFDQNDIYLFIRAISHFFKNGKYKDTIKYFNIALPILSSIQDEDIKYESSILYYWSASAYYKERNNKVAFELAKKALELLKSPASERSMISKEGENSIKKQMEALLKLKTLDINTTKKPKVKKIQRNHRVTVEYRDGTIDSNKFKKLENDIKNGLCQIIIAP
ncbi:TPA: tetratricopeptide repeat protein [Photobacterium damselae]